MKLKEIQQLPDFEEIQSRPWDVFITASSFETRAIDIAGRMQAGDHPATRKMYLKFHEHSDNTIRRRNDKWLEDHGYTAIQSSSSDAGPLITALCLALQRLSASQTIRILVDYTCMTKVMYGGIIKLLSYEEFENQNVQVAMCYCHGVYIDPPRVTRNMYVGPIAGYSYISPVIKPTALIIGLGYEANRAYGLQEYFDATVFPFITNGDVNQSYAERAQSQNTNILKAINPNHIYYYSLQDFVTFYDKLRGLCRDLSSDYRLVIAPCGPKPFTLAAMLTSIVGDSVEVWRVSAAEEIEPREKASSQKHILVLLKY